MHDQSLKQKEEAKSITPMGKKISANYEFILETERLII